MEIELPKTTQKALIASIRHYVSENMGSEIGDLQASLFLEYCLKEIGPCVYNAAITDVQKHFQEKVADLETAFYAPELGYWPAQAKR